ncbi:MAG: FAD-dependent oxidoreductase, partial [Deinococcota bacterium]
EAHDIAAGTTSACASAVILQTKPPGPKLELSLQSLKLWEALKQDLGPSVEFQQQGSLLVAEDETQWGFLQDKAKKSQANKVPVELLSNTETFERNPYIAKDIAGSSFCHLDTTVNPYNYAFAMAKLAAQQGATIMTGTRVVDLNHNANRVTDVITDKGTLSCGLVVSTLGPWTNTLTEKVGVTLPLSPRKGELLVSMPRPPLFKGAVISARYLLSKALPTEDKATQDKTTESKTPTMTAGLYASWTKRGNLLIGSTREFAGFDTSSSIAGCQALIQGAIRVLPFVENLKILRTYAGLRPASADGFPIISRLEALDNLIVATGHEGDGIALSPVTGQLVTDLASETANPWLAKTSLKRFAVEA